VLQRLVSFKERFFVAHLVPPDSPMSHRLEADDSPLHPCPVVSRRRDLIAVCARERLSFTTLDSAKFATSFILCRLVSFAQRMPALPTNAGAPEDTMPDWVHRQQQLPTLDDSAMGFNQYSLPPHQKREPMDGDEDCPRQSSMQSAAEQRLSPRLKMEEAGVSVASSLGDNMLLDGAELVRADGVLEPLGDLDDAELFADSLFSA